MNILITAGGTVESIDNVRSITNTGTGRLGSLIADEFLSHDSVDEVFYICADSAIKPKDKNANIVGIKSVADLEKCVPEILKDNKIDIIVHSMAVSDYTVRSVTDINILAGIVSEYISDDDQVEKDIEQYLIKKFDDGNLVGSNGKLSSQMKNPLIMLDKTPKILPLLREYSPDSVIVGFKLLSEVAKDELLDVAYDLLNKNKCDFVLANDESRIKDDMHEGYLMNKEKEIVSFDTKQEIAAGLVKATIESVKS